MANTLSVSLGRFDTVLLQRIAIKMKLKTSCLTTGNTLLLLRIEKFDLNFVDSFRFIQVGLANQDLGG